MSLLAFFTDPHLGLRRSSHTTLKSQGLYRDALYEHVLEQIKRLTLPELIDKPATLFCLGDLFDTFSNDEETILQGHHIASLCKHTLGGNHDVANRTDVIGSLHLIQKMLADNGRPDAIILSPDPGAPYAYRSDVADTDVSLIFVPHCLTQDVFASSLAIAASKADPNRYNILCLHCNVGDGFGDVDGHGSSLWLTSDLQDTLIQHFPLTLVGHEHEPRELHNGKIVILGNTFPVGFGEIAQRFVYSFNTETRKLTKIAIFNPETYFEQLDAAYLMESGGVIETDKKLIEITGKVRSVDFAAFTRAVMQFWKTNPELFAVRKNVETDKPLAAKRDDDAPEFVRRTLPDIVKGAVTTAGFAAEYQEVAGETDADEPK